ncbi:MAG: hypothetical protein QF689_05280 [Candidatus Latescibacteria bacterium]|jgi:hypothetical protein|nr:hypothetical protein [Gemmatimonadaceae bacterium]MDP6017238.1 hypothetical protein [Candidatus Latescibacterota bacterium]MDP7447983.1 hypothetical protein [Candidatus Latescibacterota bacterium]HJP30448.1 hypothetical protein [Candidatus Latescibacterota bacterium]
MNAARVTIAFCSGRRRVVPVVDMLVGRLRALQYTERLSLRLLVVWDRSFESAPPPHRELQLAGAGAFEEVRCIEPAAGVTLACEAGATADVEPLIRRSGYGAQRNLAVLDALRAGSDVVLFLDDDEYFAAPWRGADEQLHWRPVDPLGPHLVGLSTGAAVTNGTTLGEPSPIPRGITRHISPALLRRLGAALAAGSEFLTASSFLAGRMRLAPGPDDTLPKPIDAVRSVRRLSGGNLALDLDVARSGLLPPFYSPPAARGEDALFGARIDHLSAQRVPAYVFHDPFGRFTDMTSSGSRPVQLTPTPLTRATVARFGRALLGWIRYAPLLLRLRAPDEAWYRVGISLMREAIAEAAPALSAGLNWEGFATAPSVLSRSSRHSERDLQEMLSTEEAWRLWLRQRSGKPTRHAGGAVQRAARAAPSRVMS